MASIVGHYVKSIEEATHMLPQMMHMGSDYPFKLPKIEAVNGRVVTLVDGVNRVECKVTRRDGWDVCYIHQSSTYEKLYGCKPRRFKCLAFCDGRTARERTADDNNPGNE